MQIAIVDDCRADLSQLKRDIDRYAADHSLPICSTEWVCGETFLCQCDLDSTDVVFLDIYMGELTGVDVAKEIRRRNSSCQLVFISASPAFAVESYRVQALYYLVKPYAYEELSQVLTRVLNTLQTSLRFISIKEGQAWRKVLLCDILYVDYSNHSIQIHTHDGIVTSNMKFSDCVEILRPYPEFLNCYRCVIVNMDQITQSSDLFFLLPNKEYVPINRKRAKEMRTAYSDYIFARMSHQHCP